jgi:hypothetical protein
LQLPTLIALFIFSSVSLSLSEPVC